MKLERRQWIILLVLVMFPVTFFTVMFIRQDLLPPQQGYKSGDTIFISISKHDVIHDNDTIKDASVSSTYYIVK